MRSITAVAVMMCVSLAAGSNAFADVQVSIREAGRISISARSATVTQILTEWAKVGQTTIVNGEKIPRDPVTLELENVSEDEALEVVLRTASGYLAAPRAVAVPNASRFDRIVVMPPSVVPLPPPGAVPAAARVSAPPPAAYPAPPAYQTPAYQSSEYPQPPAPVVATSEPAYDGATDTSASDEQPIVMMIGGIPTMTPSARAQQIANTTRQALETVDPREFKLPPQPQGGAGAAPAALVRPVGVAVPGMIVQPPAPPRQPGQPPGGRE